MTTNTSLTTGPLANCERQPRFLCFGPECLVLLVSFPIDGSCVSHNVLIRSVILLQAHRSGFAEVNWWEGA